MTKDIIAESVQNDLRYLQLLARSFPTIADASTEIINLEAILNLPKGTEHFLSDLHGEDQAFSHVLRNASGAVKRKVNEIFSNTLRESEKKELCSLIYYPEDKLELIKSQEQDLEDWYQVTLNQLVRVCRNVSSKYTRSKVRKALPKEFSYIIQELLHESSVEPNKSAYVDQIICTIISTGRADDFIIAMCNLIQRLTIDLLHIIGDIYDRGPGAHLIMDILCDYHNFDVQWGNHDILWMGAASGNLVSIANVIRMCLRFGNMATLEDGYGINLLPLATFAMEAYGDDPCALFMPKTKFADNAMDEKTTRLIAQMHKAITIIQFKLEGEIIRRRPEFEMDDRMLLHHIDLKWGVVHIDGKDYTLKDTNWPTLDPKDPYRLSIEEEDLIRKILHSFESSEKMKKHMRCFFRHGGMYQVCNSNLLFHASIPMNPDGTFKSVRILGQDYKGRALLDRVDQLIRTAYFKTGEQEEVEYAHDYIWYLWGGKDSPLFDKSKMATFERAFIEEAETHKEEKGAYYTLREQEEICDKILDEFGVTGMHRHIINGHVPVRSNQGENPIKANGKMLVIDGGFSRPYHLETGIAGYTLVYHSRGFQLVQHEPFESRAKAIEEGLDIKSTTIVVELSSHRQMVKDTELQLKDLETIESQLAKQQKTAAAGNKDAKVMVTVLEAYKAELEQGKNARGVTFESKEEQKVAHDLFLLTTKPVLYVANVDEASAKSGNEYSKKVEEIAKEEGAECMVIAAKTEEDIASLETYEDKQMFLEELGLEESGVNRLIKKAYALLNLETFITAGEMEVKAWTYHKGWKAPQCAGVIHTDFEKGFIRAEVIKYDDYIQYGSEAAVREAGKLGIEGKEYVVQDGDIMHFRFNV